MITRSFIKLGVLLKHRCSTYDSQHNISVGRANFDSSQTDGRHVFEICQLTISGFRLRVGLDISAANRQQSRTLSVAWVTHRTLPTCFKRTTFIYVAQNASTQEFVSTRHRAVQSRDMLPGRLLTALEVTATRSNWPSYRNTIPRRVLSQR